jgi:NDP-sugar pyrophosphorylase family protein
MNVAILAGCLATRLSEETDVRPKPIAEVGGLGDTTTPCK